MQQGNSPTNPDITTGDSIDGIVRLIGLAIIFCGIYFGYQVIDRAWKLYEDPSSVGKLADEIESAAQLNAFVERFAGKFAPQLSSALNTAAASAKSKDPSSPKTSTTDTEKSPLVPGQLNASYFAAWAITLALLGLVGRIACWVVTAGAKTARQTKGSDKELKHVLRTLLLEVKSGSLNTKEFQ